jgi:CRISP-associated protein Cas1
MLRAILASGLHPTFGVFHKNKRNALCLVDDLMEPYRPIVDQIVKQLEQKGVLALTEDAKRCLASIVATDQNVVGSVSPMFRHMQQMTYDLSKLYAGQKIKLNPPQLLSELEVSAIVRQC